MLGGHETAVFSSKQQAFIFALLYVQYLIFRQKCSAESPLPKSRNKTDAVDDDNGRASC